MQSQNELVAGLKAKSRRLVSVRIDVAVPHVTIGVQRITYVEGDLQYTVFASQVCSLRCTAAYRFALTALMR